MSNPNPLSQYFRQPELYVQLPSQGRWWAAGSLNLPPNNEIGVRSMNGADDLAMRNADGLMNGDTTVRVVQSCCTDIKDAWEMPSVDLDTIIIAIRIASYGHQLDLTTSCDKCKEPFEYAIDLRQVLAMIEFANYDNPVAAGPLTIFLRPAPFKVSNLNSQEIYQQQKTVFSLKDSSLSQEDKERIITEALKRLTDITINRMHEFIDYIVTEDGKKITDRNFIREFVSNADREMFDIINREIQSKTAEYKLPNIPAKCPHCNHENERPLVFEPSTFFG